MSLFNWPIPKKHIETLDPPKIEYFLKFPLWPT
jgi:hypothetical protein